MSEDEPRGDGGKTVDPAVAGDPNVVDRIVEMKNRETFVAAAAVVGVLVFPALLIDVLGVFESLLGLSLGGYGGLPSLMLVFGIVVIGYNILLGYTGLLSFGHAALFGTAAYASALFTNTVVASPVLAVLVGVVAATLVSWPIGFLSIRRSGVYFAVLTLTFGQMLYFYAFGPGAEIIGSGSSAFTGGDNGYTPFQGISEVELLGSIPLNTEVPGLTFTPGANPTIEYLLIAAMTVLAIVVAHRIIKSPYGLILKALGQNQQRVEFVGLNVFRYKLMAFIISGVFAGAAGGLYTLYKSGLTVHPNGTLYWIVSGDFVIMTALGGVGSLAGPLLGAMVFEYIRLVLSGVTLPVIGEIGSLWRLLLGLTFVLVVAFFPEGIYGALRTLGDDIVDRFGTDAGGRAGGPPADPEESRGDD